MAALSSDLLWELLRDHNSYLISRSNKTFSSDPYNLSNLHTAKFAGIAKDWAVGVGKREKGQPVTLNLKKLAKHGVKGKAGHVRKVDVKRGGYTGKAKDALKSILSDRRPDLVSTALLRMKKLHDSEKPKKIISRK